MCLLEAFFIRSGNDGSSYRPLRNFHRPRGLCVKTWYGMGNIVSRSLEIPLINLGFSGNGKLEKEVVDFINEQNACVYILDCMANLTDSGEEEVKNLVKQAVWQIRKKHDTPVLLVEHAGYSNGITNQKQYDAYMRANIGQAKAYKELKKKA